MNIEKILKEHKEWVISDGEEGKRANLSEANLSEADLSGANLYRANLSGANLYRADLSGANLYRANLYRADLSGANLYRADLSEANLYRADLSEANLYRANLYRADLTGADLYRADLSGANLSEADLSEADLSFIKNKHILTFNSSQHFAYYCDGLIKIGCVTMSVNEWIENGKQIGIDNDYSSNEIGIYSKWIKSIKQFTDQ